MLYVYNFPLLIYKTINDNIFIFSSPFLLRYDRALHSQAARRKKDHYCHLCYTNNTRNFTKKKLSIVYKKNGQAIY